MVAPFQAALGFAEGRYLEIRERMNAALAAPPLFPGPAVTATVTRQGQAARAFQKRVFTRTMSRALGVDVGPMTLGSRVDRMMVGWIGKNVDLIRTIQPRFHAAMKRDLRRLASSAAFDQSELRKMVARNYGSAGYNLRRITRDQTSKLVGQLNEVRQRDVGITHYVWRTSEDERVRPAHRRNNGREFAWTTPPFATGHPGAAIQCRCNADPVLVRPRVRRALSTRRKVFRPPTPPPMPGMP